MNFLSEKQSHSVSVASVAPTGGDVTSRSLLKTCKLPTLQIKKFDGNLNEYQTFIESFEAAVHTNGDIPKIQKMSYLLSFLTEEAENSVKGLRLNSENYLKALDILKDRFGNPQVLISHHMNKILEIEEVFSISDVKGLRSLYDTLEIQIRNLESLKMNSAEYGAMLIPILMGKLPNELKIVLSKEKEWTLKNLLEKLKQEIEAREKAKLGSEEKENTINYHSQAWARNKQYQLNCVYCGNPDHKSFQCKVITKTQTRKDILFKQKRCFLCLKPGIL